MISRNKWNGCHVAENLDWPAELDNFARQLIVRRAHQVGRRPGFSSSDIPDVIQVLMFRAWQGLKSYDPTKGKRTTYIRRIVDAEVATIVRRHKARKRDARNQGSLNGVCRNRLVEHAHSLTADDDVRLHRHKRSDKESFELSHDVGVVMSRMPKKQRVTAKTLMHESQSAAARILKKSRRAVRKDIARIRAFFEDAGLAPCS